MYDNLNRGKWVTAPKTLLSKRSQCNSLVNRRHVEYWTGGMNRSCIFIGLHQPRYQLRLVHVDRTAHFFEFQQHGEIFKHVCAVRFPPSWAQGLLCHTFQLVSESVGCLVSAAQSCDIERSDRSFRCLNGGQFGWSKRPTSLSGDLPQRKTSLFAKALKLPPENDHRESSCCHSQRVRVPSRYSIFVCPKETTVSTSFEVSMRLA